MSENQRAEREFFFFHYSSAKTGDLLPRGMTSLSLCDPESDNERKKELVNPLCHCAKKYAKYHQQNPGNIHH
jgi:hypothetical protein